ncbi:MAG TPA: helix-turn-helix domain-containing protein [Candidatus Paceibacterota bacterium]|nr:helix-turn-helix domain-containing protein [Candidatus Paceibacterota bacterium]
MSAFDSAQILGFVRQQSGLTQAELAQRAGTSQSAIARYENGNASPSTTTLLRLLKAAGYELDVMVRKTPPLNLSGSRAQKIRLSKTTIKSIMKKAGASNIRLFGSVVRGQDTATSDIDFLVDFDLSKGLLPILRLNEELSDLLEDRVEVSPVGVLKEEVLKKALSEAVPL